MRLNQKNFTFEELEYSETAKKNEIDNKIPQNLENNACRLLELLQKIRDVYEKPIYITSGYRCMKLNKLVGGVSTSQHCTAEAADIRCRNNKELYNLIIQLIDAKEITVGQLIDEYNLSWIHISTPTHTHKNEIFKIS